MCWCNAIACVNVDVAGMSGTPHRRVRQRADWLGPIMLVWVLPSCTSDADAGGTGSHGPPDELHIGSRVDGAARDEALDGCMQECSMWQPGSCPPTLACKPVDCGGGGLAMRCTPADPSLGPGDACTLSQGEGGSVDRCGPGSFCLPIGPPDKGGRVPGRCTASCSGDPQASLCPASGESCVVVSRGRLPLCLATCDPLVGDCIEANAVCVVLGQPRVSACVPAPTGLPAAEGEPCECANCCRSGSACVAAGRVRGWPCTTRPCCARYCPAGSQGLCGEEEACRVIDEFADAQTAAVGVCTVR